MNGIKNGVCFAALLAQRLPSVFGSCITESDTDLHSFFCPSRKNFFGVWGGEDTILCSTKISLGALSKFNENQEGLKFHLICI